MALTQLEANSKSSPISIWTFESLSDFVRYLENQTSKAQFIVFRGQREDWPLLPKIARLDLLESLKDSEPEMFEVFKREAVALLDIPPTNDWDWLTVAQHHGLPTRLLDWTTNPLAALWFAVSEPVEDDSQDGVVWVFEPSKRRITRDPERARSPFEVSATYLYLPRHVTPRIRAQEGVFTVSERMKLGDELRTATDV